jgi:Yip1 domain
MPDTANPTDTPETVALSPIERVVNTYIEPSKTFQDIKRNRSWWLPFVILCVLGWIFCFVAVKHVGLDTLATNVLKAQPRSAEQLDKAAPAQAAQMISFTKGIMQAFMYGSPLVILIINAIFALLLWCGFAFVLGGSTNFAEMFSVAMFAALPNALNSIISIVTVMVSDPQTYNLNLPSPAALAYFISPDAPHWLITLCTSLDVISIWSLVLAGFGAAIVAKVKPSRGILLVLIVWILYVLIKTGIATASS